MMKTKHSHHFPAEWHPHRATWLSWPHNKNTWPDKINSIYSSYVLFIQQIALGEQVCINVNDEQMKQDAIAILNKYQTVLTNIHFFIHPSNDAWCRDHGPAFVIDPNSEEKKIVVDWKYNAWGEKYPPYDLDNKIPSLISRELNIPLLQSDIIMEGGSVDFNGKGTVLTTRNCLLNKNRNPHLSQGQIEDYLKTYYGVCNILWLGDGIVGDDTDGHIDDITRFVNEETVLTVIEDNKADDNYIPLKNNAEELSTMCLEDNSPLKVIELPMPSPMTHLRQRLPASYANFYICNSSVIVPTFKDKNDDKALSIIQSCFEDRTVVGIDSTDIIWGLGSFHCLSQQEPDV